MGWSKHEFNMNDCIDTAKSQLIKAFPNEIEVIRGDAAKKLYSKCFKRWGGAYIHTILLIENRAAVVFEAGYNIRATLWQFMPSGWYRYNSTTMNIDTISLYKFNSECAVIISDAKDLKKRSDKDIKNAKKAKQRRRDKTWVPVKTLSKIPENTILTYKASLSVQGKDVDISKPDAKVRIELTMKIRQNGYSKSYRKAVVDLENEKILHKDIKHIANEKEVVSEVKKLLQNEFGL